MQLNALNRQEAFEQWLNYLEGKFPGSKKRILNLAKSQYLKRFANQSVASLGQDDTADDSSDTWYDTIAQAAAAIIPTYMQYKLQSKVIDAQVARAQTGQTPLPQSYFTTVPTPTVTTKVEASDDLMNTLLIGGGILGAILLINGSRQPSRA